MTKGDAVKDDDAVEADEVRRIQTMVRMTRIMPKLKIGMRIIKAKGIGCSSVLTSKTKLPEEVSSLEAPFASAKVMIIDWCVT